MRCGATASVPSAIMTAAAVKRAINGSGTEIIASWSKSRPDLRNVSIRAKRKEIVGQISALAWAIFNHSYLNVVKTDSQFFIQGQKSTQQVCVCGGRNRKEHSFNNSSAQNIISQKTEIVVTEKSKLSTTNPSHIYNVQQCKN